MADRYNVLLVCNPDVAAYDTAHQESVPLIGIPMERKPSLAVDLLGLWRWIMVVRHYRPDITNVSTPKAALLGGLAAWVCRVPRRLYVVRGLRLEGFSGIRRRVLRGLEWLSMAVATDLVFVSPSLAAAARKEGLVGRRRAWLIGDGSSNGIDCHALAERVRQVDCAQVRRDWGLSKDAFVVGYIGRLAVDKGIDILASAMESGHISSSTMLLAVGPSEDERTYTHLHRLGSRVVVLPELDDVAPALAIIDVLCLPTRREGFPTVVLEAGAANVPVITTRATGAVDSVINGQTGWLVDVDDVDGLAKAIRLAQLNPTERTAMGAAAHTRVAGRFAPDRIWAGLVGIMSGSTGSDVTSV